MPSPAPDALQDLADSLEPYLSGTDSAAIHDDVAGEIAAISAKADPAVDDLLLIEDAADSNEKKKITVGSIAGVAGQVSALDAATILITDSIAFEDQSDSDAMKKATVQEVFAAPGWVSGLAAATILITDKLAFEDASDTLAMKEATVQEVFAAPAWIDGLTAKATPIGADILVVSDSAAAGATKRSTISSIPITQSQVASILLTPAADAAVALLNTTAAVVLTVTAAGTVVISTSSSYAGQEVQFFASAVSGGGAYTLAVVGGTLTINATGEAPRVKRDTTNATWNVIALGSATIV
jgi:hypothetical protein